jgi:hypothetical protein
MAKSADNSVYSSAMAEKPRKIRAKFENISPHPGFFIFEENFFLVTSLYCQVKCIHHARDKKPGDVLIIYFGKQ